MGDAIYNERIAPVTAKQILGDDFIAGDNMEYYLFSEYCKTTVIQLNKSLGEKSEVTLDEPEFDERLTVPKIQSYKMEVKEYKPKWVKVQFAILAVFGIITVACLIFIYLKGWA